MLTKKIFSHFLIPVPKTSLILIASCSMRDRFLEAILEADRARAGRTGAPERSTAWWLVERWEALRLALGARGCLAARGGYVNPASKGAHWCPGASHRSIPSRS